MYSRVLALAGGLLLLGGLLVFAGDAKTVVARRSAESWLALVDAGHYGQSWDQAASLFKQRVSKQQWETAVRKVRQPLGRVKSRELMGSQYLTQLPGVPDGEYVVIQYKTSFEHKKSAVETITPMRDTDGKWRVSGYFIR